MPHLVSNSRTTSMTMKTATPTSNGSPTKLNNKTSNPRHPLQPENSSLPQPPYEPTLKSKRSRTSSLFNLFTKPTVERAKGHSEPVPPLPNPVLPRNPSPERPPTRMSTRSRAGSHFSFSRDASPPPALPDFAERPPKRLSLRRLSTSKSSEFKAASKQTQSRVDAPWDPPPLFQAYPQAVKHIALKVPGPSYLPNNRDSMVGWGGGSARSRHSIFGSPTKSKRSSRKNARNSDNGEWTKKIYVLVTNGHVLEYAGDGPSERLPEQILKLGQDSAAFASDLIPGFPYVLQVLQAASGGVQVVQLPQKSLLSRLGLQLPGARRMASSLLMVFDEPEQMDSWMIAIRKQIEALGGKKCRPISTFDRPIDNLDAMSISNQRFQGLKRAASQSSLRAPSLKPVPSLSTMPMSPTYASPDRTDSANFAATDNEYPTFGSHCQQSTNNDYHDLHPTSYPAFSNVEETNGKVAGSRSRPSTPPPRIASQDFSEFYFTDHTPEDLSSMHPAHRPSSVFVASLTPKDRRRSVEPNSRRTSTAESNMSSTSFVQPEYDAPGESNDQTMQSAEYQPSSVIRGYRSWSSTTATPRFPLGPRVYSQSVTSFQSPTLTMEPIVEQAPLHNQTVHPSSEEIGLGIDSYSSVNTDSTQGESVCSEISTLTETSSFTSTRVSTSLSPFILQHSLNQSPATSNASTPRPYQSRKTLHGSPVPLQISSRAQWQTSPNLTDSPLGRNTPSPSPSNVLRRPASLPVRSDPAPFLASVAKVKGVSHQQRTSVLVPIVRPATLKPSRRQKSDNLMMELPPQLPPPTSPLPIPPGIAV